MLHSIIAQVILAFWLVLAHDLLEDRRAINLIITKFFHPCFKMMERFENLENILSDWAKNKGTKKSCRGIEQVRNAGWRKIKPFLLNNDTEKILEQSQSAVERDWIKNKIGMTLKFEVQLLDFLLFHIAGTYMIRVFRALENIGLIGQYNYFPHYCFIT